MLFSNIADIVSFTLRLREDLRRKLERAADKAERSLNIEIVERLEASFTAESQAAINAKLLDEYRQTTKSVMEFIAAYERKEEGK